MRAVWSFWSQPHEAAHHRWWVSEKHHLLAWVLSVEAARRHYPDTVLYTDSAGARLLVDALALPFDEVSTLLDGLAEGDAAWWNLGKLYAYRDQERPFLHIDGDAFLWSALPPEVEAGAVIAQNPETFAFGDAGWYQPVPVEVALQAVGGWLPEEWLAYTARRVGTALCCGIFGGHRIDFIRHYADTAIRVMEHPRNRAAWPDLEERVEIAVLFEQYLLAAILDFHSTRAHSPFHGIEARCLFATADASRDLETARSVGYTHLIGAAKSSAVHAARLEARVRRDHPEAYERVCRLFPPIDATPSAEPAECVPCG